MVFFSCIMLEITHWNYIMKALLIIPYLAISAFIPWEKFSISEGFLSNIFFDIVFILVMTKWLKLKLEGSFKFERGDVKLTAATILLAIGSIFSLKALGLGNPFIYVPALFLNLVILGPIIEEFIFRFVFIHFYAGTKWQKHLSSGFIFSMSHALSMFHAPQSWHPFFYLQISYAFVLGVICSLAFEKRNIIKPILLHMIFNLFFYVATVTNTI